VLGDTESAMVALELDEEPTTMEMALEVLVA
jgi:hypothetical protein